MYIIYIGVIIIAKVFNFIKKSSKNNLLDNIDKIKKGNIELRNKLISDYRPFIAKCICYAINSKYINQKDSDEFSIGLIAFNRSIDCFDINKGTNFLDFAQLLITRNVINYRVKNKKHSLSLPFSYIENGEFIIDNKLSSDNSSYNLDLKEELFEFKLKLEKFNINIWELVERSPKHRDAIDNCVNIAHILYNNKSYYKNFLKTKLLPIKYLLTESKTSRKTIERNRKYIISLVLLLDSNFTVLKEFINRKENI